MVFKNVTAAGPRSVPQLERHRLSRPGRTLPLDTALLHCTRCNCQNLRTAANDLVCPDRQVRFPTTGKKLRFVDAGEGAVTDTLDRRRFHFKNYRRFCNFLLDVVSPAHPAADLQLSRILHAPRQVP